MAEKKERENQKSFLAKMAADLRRLDGELKSMKKEVRKGAQSARGEYQRAYQELLEQKRSVQKRLKELKRAAAGAWGELRAGLEKSLQDLQGSTQRAVSRFKTQAGDEDKAGSQPS